MIKAIGVLAALSLLFTVTYAQTLNLVKINNAASRGAICNDGSPGAYYFSPGSGSGANTWVIHQEGGWWCWDNVTCFERAKSAPTLVSSTSYEPTMQAGGIFNNNPTLNPSFYNANLVYVKYCSSDVWSGTHVGTGNFNELAGWHFKGKYIITAVVEDMIALGMNNNDSQILITGCSAGGNGVFVNADFVRQILPFTPAKYIAFSDAGWLANFKIVETAFYDQYALGFPLWGGMVNELCTYGNQYAPYVCYFGSIVQPYMVTPVITHIEQFDIAQFTIDCMCNYNASNPADVRNMGLLRAAIFASSLTVRPPHSVFAPACAHHCSSLDASFNGITINGISLQQFLTAFWNAGNGDALGNAIDTCTDLNCSGGCFT